MRESTPARSGDTMKRTATILAFLVLALFVSSSPVLADWPIDGELDGCHTFDFTIDEQGFTAIFGSYSAGVGWIAGDYYASGGGDMRMAEIELASFPETLITSFTATYDYWQGYISEYAATGRRWTVDGVDVDVTSLGGTFEGDDREETFTPTAPGITTDGPVSFFLRSSRGDHSGSILIKSIQICGEPITEYVKPLLGSDFDSWGMYEHSGNGGYTVVAFSKEPGAFVRSAVDGIVYDIREADEADGWCDDVLDVALLACAIRVPDSVHGGNGEYVYRFGSNAIGLVEPHDRNKTFLVTIRQYETLHYFRYYVQAATLYVTEGQPVTAGCYLGKTTGMSGYSIDPTDLFGTSATQGVTIVTRTLTEAGATDELLDYLTLSPSESNPCNVSEEFARCLGSADLSDQSDWDSFGDVTWNNPGATVGTNSYISSVMNLDPDREPKMRVSARTHVGDGSVELRLGETVESFELDGSNYVELLIAGDTHQPNDGIFYDVIVKNTGNATVEIEYICVSFTKDENGDPEDPNPPGGCYFINNSFEDGISDWASTPAADVSEGAITTSDGGQWWQAATLYPGEGGPATYTIRVDFGLDYYDSYTPDETDTTASATIQYDFPGPSSWDTIDSAVTFGEIAQSDGRLFVEETFSVASETSGDFYFRANLDSEPSNVVGTTIYSVCLDSGDTTGGGEPEPWPGDYQGGEPDTRDLGCEVIPTPSGNALSDWSVWTWRKFDFFFDCKLMPLLVATYEKINDFYHMVGFLARWLIHFFFDGVEWFSDDLIPWLGGYFDNMRGGIWITGEQPAPEDDSCAWYDIFCHAGNLLGGVEDLLSGVWDGVGDVTNIIGDTLDWIAGALQFIWDDLIRPIWNLIRGALDWVLGILDDVVKPVLEWVIDLIGKIIEWIGNVWGMLVDTVTAYNSASPQSVPGFPNCAVETDNAICLFYWMTENTVFAGTAGSLIIPVLTSIFAIMFILHYIKQIKDALSEAGRVS